MEQAPGAERTVEQIHQRLLNIDHEISTLKDGIGMAGAAFQESTQGDDDATENESTEQALGGIREKIEHLEHERKELWNTLEGLKSKAA